MAGRPGLTARGRDAFSAGGQAPARSGIGRGARRCGAVVAVALASGVAVTALLLARQLSHPEAPPVFLLADTALARSRMLLLDPHAGPAALDAALGQARLGRSLAPDRAGTWLMLAYAEARVDGRLSQRAAADLRRSYQVAPLDPDVTRARLRLALGVWDQLPPDLRRDALSEIDALWARCAPDGVEPLASEVLAPTGRLAVVAEVERLELLWLHQRGDTDATLGEVDDSLETARCGR